MLKRLTIFVLLTFIFALSLTGCSSPEPSKPDTPVEFSLSQYSETEVEVEIGHYGRVNFYLLPFATTEDDIEIINSNDDVAECTFWTNGVEGKKIAVINIKGISEGSATIYLKDKNSTSKSATINITVFKKEEDIDKSRTVYTNLYGEKYHYSKSCAGETARETTLNKVKKYKEPCSKCVH